MGTETTTFTSVNWSIPDKAPEQWYPFNPDGLEPCCFRDERSASILNSLFPLSLFLLCTCTYLSSLDFLGPAFAGSYSIKHTQKVISTGPPRTQSTSRFTFSNYSQSVSSARSVEGKIHPVGLPGVGIRQTSIYKSIPCTLPVKTVLIDEVLREE